MKHITKKLLAILLAAAIVISMGITTTPEVNAASTKYKKGVYISTSYLYNSSKWVNTKITRSTIYTKGGFYVYLPERGDTIANLKATKNKAIVRVSHTGSTYVQTGSTYTYVPYVYISYITNKPGTINITFKIKKADGKYRSKKVHKFTVISSPDNYSFKNISFGGHTIFDAKTVMKNKIKTTKTISDYRTGLSSGRFYVTPNDGYKITGLVVCTTDKDGSYKARSYANGATIPTSQNPSYGSFNGGSESGTTRKYTYVYISYKDTKLHTAYKYSVVNVHGTQEIKCVHRDSDGKVYTSYYLPGSSGSSFTLYSE